MFLQAVLHSCQTQAVPFTGAVRNEAFNTCSHAAEEAAENGQRGDPIDIIVTIEGDAFPERDGLEQPLDGLRDAGNFFRSPQRGEPGRVWRPGFQRRSPENGSLRDRVRTVF